MADLGLVENTEAGEQLVGTPEPMLLGIDELEASVGVGSQDAAYTNVGLVKEFENIVLMVVSDTAPTVIQVGSHITNLLQVTSYITDILKVTSEIQDE